MSNSLYERRNRKMACFADRGLLDNYVFYRAVVGQITGLFLPLMRQGRRPNKDQKKGGQRGSGIEPSLGVPLLPLGSETRRPVQMHHCHASWSFSVSLLCLAIGLCTVKSEERFQKLGPCTTVWKLALVGSESTALSRISILFG